MQQLLSWIHETIERWERTDFDALTGDALDELLDEMAAVREISSRVIDVLGDELLARHGYDGSAQP